MVVKFIDYWMFASQLWADTTELSPVAINLREISHISEEQDEDDATCVVTVNLKNGYKIPIDGNIIEILAEFQKHLTNMY